MLLMYEVANNILSIRNNFADSPLLTMDSTALTATKSHITPVITKVVNSVEIKSCFVI